MRSALTRTALHGLELLLFLACLHVIARWRFASPTLAWLGVAAALSCKELSSYAALLLTESLFLAAIGVFLLGWMGVQRAPRDWRACAVLGIGHALTAAVKPIIQAAFPMAAALFDDSLWRKLGWSADVDTTSTNKNTLHPLARQAAMGASAIGWLLDRILQEPAWHGATSLLLLWRGLFVGKLWGLLALLGRSRY